MQLQAGACTHPGRAKDINQDAYALFDEHRLYVIADGMGGMNGGEVAAAITVERVPHLLIPELSGAADLGELFRSTLNRVSWDIWQQSATSRALYGMGATVVVAHVRGTQLTLAHAGDARAYLWRADSLRQLTEDHSLVYALLKQGTITPQQAQVHPWRSQLIRHMGLKSLESDTQVLDLQAQDRLLLCSDGLNKEVPDEDIKTLLGTAETAQQAADRLVDRANERGGRDNITALVVFVGP